MLHTTSRSSWNSGFGSVTRQLVQELTPQHVFTPQQVQQRNAIGEMLHQGGLDQPLSMQLMLANFLLSPPGLLTINNIDQFFQPWLSSAYHELYGSGPSSQARPAEQTTKTLTSGGAPSVPDFGPFPSTLKELVSNRLQLNRLLAVKSLLYRSGG